MKQGYWYLTAVVLVVFAVAAAGCTSGTTASAGGQGSSGNTGSSTGSPAPASPSPAVGSVLSSSSVFSKNWNWIEYKTTSNYNGAQNTQTTRTEQLSGSYQGDPAVHLKMTGTNPNGQVQVTDLYYDMAKKTVLGGTMTMTVNGKTVTTEYPQSALQNNQRQGDFTTEYTLTFAGIEPVSVPLGTYPAAGKYTSTRNEAQITFWSAPPIPVAVKYVYTTPQGTSTAELMGWG